MYTLIIVARFPKSIYSGKNEIRQPPDQCLEYYIVVYIHRVFSSTFRHHSVSVRQKTKPPSKDYHYKAQTPSLFKQPFFYISAQSKSSYFNPSYYYTHTHTHIHIIYTYIKHMYTIRCSSVNHPSSPGNIKTLYEHRLRYMMSFTGITNGNLSIRLHSTLFPFSRCGAVLKTHAR